MTTRASSPPFPPVNAGAVVNNTWLALVVSVSPLVIPVPVGATFNTRAPPMVSTSLAVIPRPWGPRQQMVGLMLRFSPLAIPVPVGAELNVKAAPTVICWPLLTPLPVGACSAQWPRPR